MTMRMLVPILAAAAVATLGATPAAATHERFPWAADPAWSPDGKSIAYVRTQNERTDLYVMAADGSRQRRLLPLDGAEADPRWSPDGTRIVFSSLLEGNRDIYVVGVDGNGLARLTETDATDRAPDWSPDGRQIVFTSRRTGTSQLFVMDADGQNERQLVDDGEVDIDPAWSLDGTRIAFVGGPDDAAYIDVVEVETGARRRLTSSGSDYSPSWTRDGRVVFVSYEGDDPTVVSVDANGGDLRVIDGLGDGVDEPAISPDGRTLLYEGDTTGESQIHIADLRSRDVKRLTGLPRVLASNGWRCTLWGTPGRDVLVGTPGDDVICGLAGDDVVRGRGGDDLVDGGAGDDVLDGGRGEDTFLGGGGADSLRARDGVREHLDGGAGVDSAIRDAGDWVSFVELL